MIELNSKTQQDFLNREWAQKLLDAGVDMSDAKYRIVYSNGKDFITTKDWTDEWVLHECCPTYTVSELLYKLHTNNSFRPDCLSVDILSFTSFLCSVDMDNNHEVLVTNGPGCRDSYIQSLASLLIQCHKKDIGIKTKDTGNISSK